MICSSFAPFVVKAQHLKDFRDYVEKVKKKTFIDAFSWITYSQVSPYNTLCSYLFWNKRLEYKWIIHDLDPGYVSYVYYICLASSLILYELPPSIYILILDGMDFILGLFLGNGPIEMSLTRYISITLSRMTISFLGFARMVLIYSLSFHFSIFWIDIDYSLFIFLLCLLTNEFYFLSSLRVCIWSNLWLPIF